MYIDLYTNTTEVESTELDDWMVAGSGRGKAAQSSGLGDDGAVQRLL